MATIIDGKDYSINIYWDDPEAQTVEPVEIARLNEKSRPMAMLVLNISALVMEQTGLEAEDFDVIVHHSPKHGAYFSLLPAEDLPEDIEAQVEEALLDYLDDFSIHAEATPGLVAVERRYGRAEFANVRCLMNALYSQFCADDAVFTTDQIAAAEMDEEQLAQARESGPKMLRNPWVMATIPERHYADLAAVEKAAHFNAMAPLPCAFSAIEDAVRKSERAFNDATPAQRRRKDFNPFGMRLN